MLLLLFYFCCYICIFLCFMWRVITNGILTKSTENNSLRNILYKNQTYNVKFYDSAVYIFKVIDANFRWIFWLFQTVDLDLSNFTWSLEVDISVKAVSSCPFRPLQCASPSKGSKRKFQPLMLNLSSECFHLTILFCICFKQKNIWTSVTSFCCM